MAKLEQFVPIVARVHGDSHPEFHQVHNIFEEMKSELKTNVDSKPAIDEALQHLRQITNNYEIPKDVCETYAAVYNMLAELDSAYQEKA